MATNRFLIPEIIVGQAQKEVTHNEGLGYIDALLKNPLVGEASTTPPASPAEGDIHTIGVGGTGAFLGQDGNIALYVNALWVFSPPFAGLTFYSNITNDFLYYDGTAWQSFRATIAAGTTIWGGITGTLSAQTDLQAALDLKVNNTTLALKEDILGNPATDGYILSSTIAGVRSWIAPGSTSVAWGAITGTITSQTDLSNALAAKEDSLGNPTTDGDVLSSTISGVRSWIPAAVSNAWGSITGTLSNQTDLQAALDAKEPSAGNPTVDGQVLSSTIAGVRSWITPSTSGGGGISDYFVAKNHLPNGTAGGSVAAASSTVRPINTINFTAGITASLATNVVTLSTGIYDISLTCSVFGTGVTQIVIFDGYGNAQISFSERDSIVQDVGASGGVLTHRFILTVAGTSGQFFVSQYSELANANGMGKPLNPNTNNEVYLTMTGLKIG